MEWSLQDVLLNARGRIVYMIYFIHTGVLLFCGFFCFINLFIYLFLFLAVLGLCSVRGLSLVAASGARASHCRGFSCCRARALGPGIEPVSPALAGRFPPTAPLGKPCVILIDCRLYFLL